MSSEYSMARYEYHHGRWIAAKQRHDWLLDARTERQARRHLYALRAHLRQLGWLAAQYDVPGYGVR